MNNNDAFSSLISTLFTGPGDQPAYDADYSNRDNGLIYTANKKTAVGAKESMKMDFSPRRPRRRAKAERDSVERCHGRRSGARNAEGAHKEIRQG